MLDEKFWEKYMKVYDCLNLLIPYQQLLKDVCDLLDIKRGETILEAGCGTGNLALKIKEKGAIMVGLENCKEALEVCRKKDHTLNLVLADLTEKLPFPDNYFDKIACNNALYAIPENRQLAVLKEFYRILKPGGKVVIGNPIKGWNAFRIYIKGIKKHFKKEGVRKTLLKAIKMIRPTIKMLYYNHLIKNEKQYHFFEFNEQRELLRSVGFSNLTDTISVYEGQSILNSGYK